MEQQEFHHQTEASNMSSQEDQGEIRRRPKLDKTNNVQQRTNRPQIAQQSGKSQLSSFILFASLIILINLCPFQADFDGDDYSSATNDLKLVTTTKNDQYGPPREACDESKLATPQQTTQPSQSTGRSYMNLLRSSFEFVKLMFSQPVRFNKRVTRFTQAEARVLGKMAKVWYIKKKIKKLSKKLKKHTIAVPVFTAIPIYEHSYYPQPHVTHVSHGAMHHAASSYSPTAVAQMAAAASSTIPMTASSGSPPAQQQLATSASSQHQVASYRMAPAPRHQSYGSGMYHPSASAHHIINAYAPSPPLFVDDSGGLYGHYGNAYGRYDGGYHVW